MRRSTDTGEPRRVRWAPQRRQARSAHARACAVLEVDTDASWETVEAAYRRLARQYHPDTPSGTTEQMASLNAAFECLRDNHARNAPARAAANQPTEQRREGPDDVALTMKGQDRG